METTPSLACANKCVFCWRLEIPFYAAFGVFKYDVAKLSIFWCISLLLVSYTLSRMLYLVDQLIEKPLIEKARGSLHEKFLSKLESIWIGL